MSNNPDFSAPIRRIARGLPAGCGRDGLSARNPQKILGELPVTATGIERRYELSAISGRSMFAQTCRREQSFAGRPTENQALNRSGLLFCQSAFEIGNELPRRVTQRKGYAFI
jgi:hypothetical protein